MNGHKNDRVEVNLVQRRCLREHDFCISNPWLPAKTSPLEWDQESHFESKLLSVWHKHQNTAEIWPSQKQNVCEDCMVCWVNRKGSCQSTGVTYRLEMRKCCSEWHWSKHHSIRDECDRHVSGWCNAEAGHRVCG